MQNKIVIAALAATLTLTGCGSDLPDGELGNLSEPWYRMGSTTWTGGERTDVAATTWTSPLPEDLKFITNGASAQLDLIVERHHDRATAEMALADEQAGYDDGSLPMVSLRTSVTALRDETDRLTVRWDQWESTLVQIRHYLEARRIGRCVVFTELRTIEHVHDEQTALALFATLETGTDLSWCTTG